MVGQDLMDVHPRKIARIHDGFFITQMAARLYDVNKFLGFSGLFPRGLEPSCQIGNYSKAVLYANHPQQAGRETAQVFHVTASAADTAEQGVTTVNKATNEPDVVDTTEQGVTTVNEVTDEPDTNNTVEQEIVNTNETTSSCPTLGGTRHRTIYH